MLNFELKKQMERNDNVQRRKLEKEKLTDSVNMGALNRKLYDERRENMDNRRQQQ